MTNLEEFFTSFNGHNNSYSSYMLIGKGLTAQYVLDALMKLDPEMRVGSGYEEPSKTEGYTVVRFEICKGLPELVSDITKELNCIGYADMDWDTTYYWISQNGDGYDNFTAEWDEDMPYDRSIDGEDDLYDAFVTITDSTTGDKFKTGAGAVDKDVMDMFADLVHSHTR